MNNIHSIAFDHISFAFGDESVLDAFDVEVHASDHLVISGESGSGKTTALQLLLGFIEPDAGTIHIRTDQEEVISPRELRAYTAWLPQELDLGEGSLLDVLDRVGSFQVNRKLDASREKVNNVLSRLGLSDDLAEKQLPRLSTGQRQRAGAAICYLLEKPVVLLDEPTSALDETNKKRMADLFLEDRDRLVISTSHDAYWRDQATVVAEVD